MIRLRCLWLMLLLLLAPLTLHAGGFPLLNSTQLPSLFS
ncbi:MAG: hypothetical protein FD134_1041, partial [Gallionellaceae bacterium]